MRCLQKDVRKGFSSAYIIGYNRYTSSPDGPPGPASWDSQSWASGRPTQMAGAQRDGSASAVAGVRRRCSTACVAPQRHLNATHAPTSCSPAALGLAPPFEAFLLSKRITRAHTQIHTHMHACSDINGVDRSPSGRYLLTGDDSGMVGSERLQVPYQYSPYGHLPPRRLPACITAQPLLQPLQLVWRDVAAASYTLVLTIAYSCTHTYTRIHTHNCTHTQVNLLNYPCVVESAPAFRYRGHSAHVTSVGWSYDETYAVSTGGRDRCVRVWGAGGQGACLCMPTSAESDP